MRALSKRGISLIVTFSNVAAATKRTAHSVACALDADLVADGDPETFCRALERARSVGGDLVAVADASVLREADVRGFVDLAVIVVHDDRSTSEALSAVRIDDASRSPGTRPIWILDLRAGPPGRLGRNLFFQQPAISPSRPFRPVEDGLRVAGMLLLAAFDPWAGGLTRYRLTDAMAGGAESEEMRERLMAVAERLEDLNEPCGSLPRTMRRDRRVYVHRRPGSERTRQSHPQGAGFARNGARL